MKKIFYSFIVISGLSLPSVASASSVAVAQGNIQRSQQELQQMTDPQQCLQFEQRITTYCTQNTALAEARVQQDLVRLQAQAQAQETQGQEGGQTRGQEANLRGIANARENPRIIRMIGDLCDQAAQRCDDLCRMHNTNLVNQITQVPPPPNVAQLQQEQQQAQNTIQTCQQEKQNFESKEQATDMSLQEVLQALLALKDLFGSDDEEEVADLEEEEEEDKCEGKYGHLIDECKGQSDPKGVRASLAGVAGLEGGTSNGLGNLFDTGDGGEPGGDRSGSDRNNGFGGSPFGAAGLSGAGGFGGTNAGGGTGSGEGKEGLNTDIQKGYMGTGGGFGGGGGGGGARRASAGRFGSTNSGLNAAGLNKADLQKKLSKYTQSQDRKPASAGGANGPFESNWAIIRKAYKKNSSSMFHQQ